jgi:hypothetical protein
MYSLFISSQAQPLSLVTTNNSLRTSFLQGLGRFMTKTFISWTYILQLLYLLCVHYKQLVAHKWFKGHKIHSIFETEDHFAFTEINWLCTTRSIRNWNICTYLGMSVEGPNPLEAFHACNLNVIICAQPVQTALLGFSAAETRSVKSSDSIFFHNFQLFRIHHTQLPANNRFNLKLLHRRKPGNAPERHRQSDSLQAFHSCNFNLLCDHDMYPVGHNRLELKLQTAFWGLVCCGSQFVVKFKFILFPSNFKLFCIHHA